MALSPAGVVPRGIPEGYGARRCQGVAEQGLLKLTHRQCGRRNLVFPAEGRCQTRRLADVEDEGLEPGGAIGHVAAAEAFICCQQVVDAGADQGPIGDAKGGTGPTASPAATLGSQGPVRPRIVVIVGIVAHGDGKDGALAVEGQGRDRLPWSAGKQLLLGYHLKPDQTAALAPVGHQGQGSGTLEARACHPVPGHGEGLAGLQPAVCGTD